MSDEKEPNSVQDQSGSGDVHVVGNVHVVPEILVAIAERNILNTEGVIRMADLPNRNRTPENITRMNGIQLDLNKEGAIFDLYVILDGNRDFMAVAEKAQASIVEGVAQMVGTSVSAVNVHIEDAEFPEVTVA